MTSDDIGRPDGADVIQWLIDGSSCANGAGMHCIAARGVVAQRLSGATQTDKSQVRAPKATLFLRG
jgi:hypothetical protein